MGTPSKQLREFMTAHEIDSDEVWEVRTNGAWAIKHAALERVCVKRGISFSPPTIIEGDGANRVVALWVLGKMGDRTEWSIGEASPANNKNSYCYAMAEKRAKDRCALKLLNSHGALYSEAEADEFEKRPNPHVTRPEDIMPPTEFDEHGEIVDNIPRGDDRIERMPKAKAKNDYAVAQHEMRLTKTPADLVAWGKKNANRIESYPTDWQEILRGQYTEHMNDLRATQQAAQ